VAPAGAGGPRAGADPVSALGRRVQSAMLAAAVRWRDVERVGPFTATFARGSGHPAFNYAVPDEGAEPSAAEVDALAAAYASRGLLPRLEYVAALAPAVEPALAAGGFGIEARTPLMVLGSRTAAAPEPAGIELAEAVSAEDVLAAVTAQHEAYGEPARPTEAWIAGVQRSIAAGGLLVLARAAATGDAVGGGQCTAPEEGATELTSIGVRPAFRRRGVAAALTSRLAAAMRERGAELVYLTAADDGVARIYAGVGFERIGTALYVSLHDDREEEIA